MSRGLIDLGLHICYTGGQNRLAEALAWELVERDIRSIATNPGPVHSDRIYKTVYPKAALNFYALEAIQSSLS